MRSRGPRRPCRRGAGPRLGAGRTSWARDRPRRRRRRPRRRLPALEVLQGQAAEEVGQADAAGLLQVIEPGVDSAHQDLGDAEPEVDLGPHLLLVAVAIADAASRRVR